MISKNAEKLFNQLNTEGAYLWVDNDCCGVRSDLDESFGDSYDFGPEELVFIFGDKFGIRMEKV